MPQAADSLTREPCLSGTRHTMSLRPCRIWRDGERLRLIDRECITRLSLDDHHHHFHAANALRPAFSSARLSLILFSLQNCCNSACCIHVAALPDSNDGQPRRSMGWVMKKPAAPAITRTAHDCPWMEFAVLDRCPPSQMAMSRALGRLKSACCAWALNIAHLL